MKILHILLSIDPAYGGPALSAPSLAAAQASLGHEISLAFYGAHPEQDSIEQARRSIPGLDRVSLVLLGKSSFAERALALNGRSVMRNHIPHCDFIHIHDMWRPILAAAATQAGKHNIPYAISPRGALNHWSMAQKRAKKQLALSLIWRQILSRASFIHALNGQESDQIEKLGLPCPVFIAPNGIFPSQLDATPAIGSFRASQPKLGQKRFILFLSRLHKKKGLDILIEAFGQLAPANPDVDLVIAGPEEGAGVLLESMISTHQLTDRVHLVGPLYGTEKLAAFRDASIFCLPSRDEGFSMAIIEAMAAGLPVVISEQCNFPEAGAANAGIVCPLNPADIARGLSSLLNDESLRTQVAANGQELVGRNYSWEAIAGRMVDAYNKAQEKQPPHLRE